jgi:hypothetical protein
MQHTEQNQELSEKTRKFFLKGRVRKSPKKRAMDASKAVPQEKERILYYTGGDHHCDIDIRHNLQAAIALANSEQR